MENIIDYSIAVGKTISQLMKDVNDSIRRGWQPLGGITSRSTENLNCEYCQALVKYQKAES